MADRVIGFEIDLFIFDAAPHPFDEHVVTPGTLSIHGQKNLPAEHRVGEFICGELAALIRIDDLRQPVFRKRLLQRLDCMATLQRDRHPMCQHPTARPVHYGRQIYEAPCHRDIARIERPDLIGPVDLPVAQQVRPDPVGCMLAARIWVAVQSLEAPALHPGAHLPGLLCHRQGVVAIDHRLTPSSPALLSAPSKKSFSSVNCPIFACSTFTSMGGATELALPASNTSATRSCNCFFQSVIWFGWTSNCWASSASVLSPLRAASATFALNAGECARRFRFVIFWFLVAGHYDRLTPQLFHLTNCPNSRRHLWKATCNVRFRWEANMDKR